MFLERASVVPQADEITGIFVDPVSWMFWNYEQKAREKKAEESVNRGKVDFKYNNTLSH